MELKLFNSVTESIETGTTQTLEKYTWIEKISNGGSHLKVIDGYQGSSQTGYIPVDMVLSDGSLLSDPRHRIWLKLVYEYAELFQMHTPETSISVFKERVKSLLKFIYWLNHRGVRRLENVTKSHLTQYAKEASFGTEAVLGTPKKLHKTMQNVLRTDSVPMQKGNNVIQRLSVYELAGVNVFKAKRVNPGTLCARIMDFYDIELSSGSDAEKLADIGYEALVDKLEIFPQQVTEQTLHRQLLPIDEIYQWGEYVKSTHLSLMPYPEGSGKLASVLGAKAGRTPSIPAKVAFPLIQEAARWVEDLSEFILDFYDGRKDAEQINDWLSAQGFNVSLTRASKHEMPYVSTRTHKINEIGLIRLLATACFIVIASLTARRKEELGQLVAGCYDDGWLSVYIEKTSQRMDSQPVPPLVGKAIDILEKISGEARELYKTDSIFVLLDKSTELIEYDPARYLNRFYEITIKEKVGIEWRFSPHQFRRFFALIYYHRFDDAALGILSFHLRHFNIEMTKRYVTDQEFGKEMREAGEEWKASFLRDVISGKRAVGGKAGNKIKKKIHDWAFEFRNKVDVVDKEKVVSKMMKYMNRLGASFTQQVWGTICTSPLNTSFAKYSACKTVGEHPDYANADEIACGGCPFACHTNRFAPSVGDKIEDEQRNLTSSPEGSVWREKAEIRLISLQGLLNSSQSVEPIFIES